VLCKFPWDKGNAAVQISARVIASTNSLFSKQFDVDFGIGIL